MTLIEAALVIGTVWSPIWAWLIWQLEVEDSNYYLYTAVLLQTLTVYLATNPVRVKGVTPWLHWYSFFLMVYLLMIGTYYRFKHFNKALSISIFILFIAGEWWEIPIFIFDGLGKTGLLINQWTGSEFDGIWIFSHIRRLFTIASAYLFALTTGIRANGFTWYLIVLGFFLSFTILYPLSSFTVPVFDTANTLARIAILSLIPYITIAGLEEAESG